MQGQGFFVVANGILAGRLLLENGACLLIIVPEALCLRKALQLLYACLLNGDVKETPSTP